MTSQRVDPYSLSRCANPAERPAAVGVVLCRADGFTGNLQEPKLPTALHSNLMWLCMSVHCSEAAQEGRQGGRIGGRCKCRYAAYA
eukprot:3946036-Amphidinium_carterae.1